MPGPNHRSRYHSFFHKRRTRRKKMLKSLFSNPKNTEDWQSAFASPEQYLVFKKQLRKYIPIRLFYEVKSVFASLSKRSLQEIVGPLDQFLKPVGQYTEWAYVIDKWKEGDWRPLFKLFLIDFISLFSLGCGTIAYLHGRKKPTWVELAGREYDQHNEEEEQLWFFINGVGVTTQLHYYVATQLAHCVKKSVYCLHNSTSGLDMDLLQCITDRSFDMLNSPVLDMKQIFARIVRQYPMRKIILCVHSQGAIMASQMIQRMIVDYDADILTRMEVYTFGSAAIRFYHFVNPLISKKERYPFYEHFANLRDFVAKIGILRQEQLPNMPGEVYISNVEGHMFGEHYLPGITQKIYFSTESYGEKIPRFYSYVCSDHGIFRLVEKENH